MPEKQPNYEPQNEWHKRNSRKTYYYIRKSTARGFIKNNATLEDLYELEGLIKERRVQLNAKDGLD